MDHLRDEGTNGRVIFPITSTPSTICYLEFAWILQLPGTSRRINVGGGRVLTERMDCYFSSIVHHEIVGMTYAPENSGAPTSNALDPVQFTAFRKSQIPEEGPSVIVTDSKTDKCNAGVSCVWAGASWRRLGRRGAHQRKMIEY